MEPVTSLLTVTNQTPKLLPVTHSQRGTGGPATLTVTRTHARSQGQTQKATQPSFRARTELTPCPAAGTASGEETDKNAASQLPRSRVHSAPGSHPRMPWAAQHRGGRSERWAQPRERPGSRPQLTQRLRAGMWPRDPRSAPAPAPGPRLCARCPSPRLRAADYISRDPQGRCWLRPRGPSTVRSASFSHRG